MASRELKVVVTGDTKDLNRAFAQAEGRSKGLGKAFGALGLAAAGGVAVGLKSAVTAAADFEAQLDALGAVSNASAKQMSALKKQALDAGAATKFSALEAAAAQTELAKGGVSLRDIMKGGLNGALALAAAGEMELADAAATTANALNLFGLEGRRAGHVADALAKAANTTTADVSDFAMALTQGGATAKAVGFTLNETVAVLEALADAGVKNSDAGTSMKTAFIQLASPSAAQAEVMHEMGLEFFTANGEMKGLAEMSRHLRDRLGDLTRQQQIHALSTVAGTDGVRTLLAIMGAGPEKMRAYQKGLQEQGTAADVAAKKQDNLKGKLENFMGSIETLQIQVGSHLIPALTAGAEAATTFVNQLSTGEGVGGAVASTMTNVVGAVRGLVTGFQQGDASARALIGTLAGAAAGFAAFKVITTVTAGVNALKAAWKGLTTAIATNPFGALAIGITAVVTGLGVFSTRNRDSAASAREFNDALRAQADALRTVRDIDVDLAARRANLLSATSSVEAAEQRLRQLRRSGNATGTELRQAEADLAQARVSHRRAIRDVADAEADSTRKREDASRAITDAREKTRSLIGAKQDEVDSIQGSINWLQAQGARYGDTSDKVAGLRQKQKALRDEIARLKSKTVDVNVKFKWDANLPKLTDVPPVPLSGDGVGDGIGFKTIRAGAKNWAQKAADRVSSSAAGAFGIPNIGGFSGGLDGARPSMAPFAALGARFGLHVSSGRLHHSRLTKTGNVSFHSTGEAIDLANGAGPDSAKLQAFNALATMAGSRLAELIYTPAGYSIKNGQRVAPYAQADHYDHVHVAFDTGTPGPGDGWGKGRALFSGDGVGRNRAQLPGAQLAAQAAYAAGFRGQDLINMVAIAGRESQYNTAAHNYDPPRDDSWGLWQINVLPNANPKYKSWKLTDPFVNAKAAHQLFAASGYKPWVGLDYGNARSFLPRAARAVASLRSRGILSGGGGAGGGTSTATLPSPFEQRMAALDVGLAGAEGTPAKADDVKALEAIQRLRQQRLNRVTNRLGNKDIGPQRRYDLTQERAQLIRDISQGQEQLRELRPRRPRPRLPAFPSAGLAFGARVAGGTSLGFASAMAETGLAIAEAGDDPTRLTPALMRQRAAVTARANRIRQLLRKRRLSPARRMALQGELAGLVTQGRELGVQISDATAGPSPAGTATLGIAEASLTADLGDDLTAAERMRDVRGNELAAARKTGDTEAITAAIDAFKQAGDAVKSLTDEIEAAKPTLQDFSDLRIAEASLTEDLGDDLAAYQDRAQKEQEELDAARATGDPQTIIAAINEFKSASDAAKQVQEQIAQRDEERRREEEERRREEEERHREEEETRQRHTEALNALTGELKRQNDIHAQVVRVNGAEAIRAFADAISSTQAGSAFRARLASAGSGSGVLIPHA